MLQRTRLTVVASLLAGSLCAGCVDPKGEYGDFQERDRKTTIPAGSGCLGDSDAGTDAAPSCDPVNAAQLTGQWLFGIAATLGPTKPILFFTDIVATDTGSGVEWTWTITPLDATTRMPLTALAPLKPSTVPTDGKWSVDLDPISIPGAANTISTGLAIDADAALTGDVCGGRDFLCGDVTGSVTKPVTLNLDGSTWSLARLPAPNTLPETIYVNCQCNVADDPVAP